MRYQIQAKGNKSAELLIYGDIGADWMAEESNDAKTIVGKLEKIGSSPLTVRINSYGGSVPDGLAIYNALKSHAGEVTAQVDGVAFSVASMIAMGADKVQMAENAIMMIHAPWGAHVGNAADMRDMADTLDRFAEAMISSYSRVDADKVAGWLTDGKDHYFTAAEAQAEGLVDELTAPIDIAAALRPAARFNPPQGKQTEHDAMTDEKTGTGGHKQPDFMENHTAAVKAGISQGAQGEHTRIRDIQAIFADIEDTDGSLKALEADCIADLNCSTAVAQSRIIAALKARTGSPIAGAAQADRIPQPSREQIRGGADQIDKLYQGATKALSIKAGLITDQDEIRKEYNSEFLSMSLIEMGKHCMRLEGKRAAGNPTQVAAQIVGAGGPGLGSDHFPAILENIANKSVMAGYDSADEVWNQWTEPGVLNDYRTASRVNKSMFDLLDKMEEFESFKHGRFADVKQNITGYLHGKSFSLTLQAIVNDDMNMLTGDAEEWGRAANTTIGDAVWVVLTASGTGGYGQTMDEDSKILFHADHSNFIDTGSGGAPADATISAARTAIMGQTDPNGRQLGTQPRYLLHGTGLTFTVRTLLNSQIVVTGEDATRGNVNPVSTVGLQGIEEYRFDSFVSTAWILAAARRTVEVAFVGGQRRPAVMRMPPGEVPGVTWQISIPFGVAALDYRTMYFNYGA